MYNGIFQLNFFFSVKFFSQTSQNIAGKKQNSLTRQEPEQTCNTDLHSFFFKKKCYLAGKNQKTKFFFQKNKFYEMCNIKINVEKNLK